MDALAHHRGGDDDRRPTACRRASPSRQTANGRATRGGESTLRARRAFDDARPRLDDARAAVHGAAVGRAPPRRRRSPMANEGFQTETSETAGTRRRRRSRQSPQRRNRVGGEAGATWLRGERPRSGQRAARRSAVDAVRRRVAGVERGAPRRRAPTPRARQAVDRKRRRRAAPGRQDARIFSDANPTANRRSAQADGGAGRRRRRGGRRCGSGVGGERGDRSWRVRRPLGELRARLTTRCSSNRGGDRERLQGQRRSVGGCSTLRRRRSTADRRRDEGDRRAPPPPPRRANGSKRLSASALAHHDARFAANVDTRVRGGPPFAGRSSGSKPAAGAPARGSAAPTISVSRMTRVDEMGGARRRRPSGRSATRTRRR